MELFIYITQQSPFVFLMEVHRTLSVRSPIRHEIYPNKLAIFRHGIWSIMRSRLCSFHVAIMRSWLRACIAVTVDSSQSLWWWPPSWGYRPTWASCQIRQIADAHAPGMPGTLSPPPQVSDPDMHHDTCVTHVPWCMPRSLVSGFLWSWRRGKHSRHSGACASRNLAYLVRGPLHTDNGIALTC